MFLYNLTGKQRGFFKKTNPTSWGGGGWIRCPGPLLALAQVLPLSTEGRYGQKKMVQPHCFCPSSAVSCSAWQIPTRLWFSTKNSVRGGFNVRQTTRGYFMKFSDNGTTWWAEVTLRRWPETLNSSQWGTFQTLVYKFLMILTDWNRPTFLFRSL